MAKHAPRGPIKAKADHMDASHHTEAPQCTATAKGSRQRCKRRPIPGGTVCVKHGGGAPQVQEAAMARLLKLQHPAIDALTELMVQKEYPSTRYAAARDVLDRTIGKPAESVAVTHSGGIDVRWMGED
jgi:hypothetical protein